MSARSSGIVRENKKDKGREVRLQPVAVVYALCLFQHGRRFGSMTKTTKPDYS